MKKLLLIQPGLHGDIIICLPIARHYARRGYEIHWPVPDGWTYRALMKRAPYVKPIFMAFSDSRIFIPIYQLADRGEFDRILDTTAGMMGSREGFPSPNMSFVAYKYKRAGVPIEDRYKLEWTRDRKAENEVYRKVVGKLPEYCLVHDKTWAGTHEFEENGTPFVKFRPVGKTSIFDWLKVIEGAREIKCIDSSLSNFIETLPSCLAKKKELVHRSSFAINSIYRSNWKITQGRIPLPQGTVGYKSPSRQMEVPVDLICGKPPIQRGLGRVFVYSRKSRGFDHLMINDLPNILDGRKVFVNDSRARRGKIYLHRDTGHRVECVLIRKIKRGSSRNCWAAQISGAPEVLFDGELRSADGTKVSIETTWILDGTYVINPEKPLRLDVYGETPLPTGIIRSKWEEDQEFYEGVFANQDGGVMPDPSAARLSSEVLAQMDVALVTHHADASQFSGGDQVEQYYRTPTRSCRGVAVGVGALTAIESAFAHGNPSGWSTLKGRPSLGQGLLIPFPLPHEPEFQVVQLFTGPTEAFRIYQEAIKRRYEMWHYGDLLLLM